MRQKLLYIAFVLGIVFLLIFINRKDAIINTPNVRPFPPQISTEEQGLLSEGAKSILPSQDNSRITIIKKAKPKEETILPETRKAINAPTKKEPVASSSSIASSGKGAGQAASGKPAAGVTKIGKRPTPQQTNELNEQGIIMY